MKKSLIGSGWAILAAAGVLVGGRAGADIVYNNSTNDLFTRFNPGLAEVGDEVVLAGSGSLFVTNFVFQYWATGLDGVDDAYAQIRFYANDGTNAPGGATIFVPETLLFDSGTFSITNNARATLVFDQTQLGGGVWVSNSFTWSVQFSGIDGSEAAGVDLYSPPTVGGNYPDYWDNAGSFDWRLRTITIDGTNGPANFGALIEAVPEPKALLLGLLGGLVLLGLRHRMVRR